MTKSPEEITAEFDIRLEKATQRIMADSAKMREENRLLEALVLEKQALLRQQRLRRVEERNISSS